MDKPDLSGSGFGDFLPSYLIKIHPGGQAIYIMLLMLIMIAITSLPLVSVQVSVSGAGIIRPIQEKTRIIAASSGVVSRIYANEGEMVRKSEPLLEVRSLETQKNLITLRKEIQETESRMEDLVGLTSIPLKIPGSDKYIKEYEEYQNQVDYLNLIRMKAETELNRNRGLFELGLISEKEYDDLVFTAEKAGKELNNFISRSENKWQNEYNRMLFEKRKLSIQIRHAEENIRLNTILAPVTGNMVEFSGIFEGSTIQEGSVIGILSPESALIGEFYVPPQKIAFLDKGQKVHLYLDAFSARDWGLVTGEIYEISSDFIIRENQPVYRVKCKLDQVSVSLKNGFSSKIRKGMTFRARCLVRQRTLFQLLSDKTENWLHPALSNHKFSLLP